MFIRLHIINSTNVLVNIPHRTSQIVYFHCRSRNENLLFQHINPRPRKNNPLRYPEWLTDEDTDAVKADHTR